MPPIESGQPREQNSGPDVPSSYGHQGVHFNRPEVNFTGAASDEITNPYAPEDTQTEPQPGTTEPQDPSLTFVRPQPDAYARGMRRAGMAVAALSVATTAGVIGVSMNHEAPEPGPSASATATPKAETPKHATKTPAPKETAATNGTSTAEKAAALATKEVDRLTYDAHNLQGKTTILGIEHDSDNDCLDGTPYANGTVQVQGVLQPGPSVVKIHPEDQAKHPGEPDLVFESDPAAFVHGIKPADDYTAKYAKKHDC